SSGVWKSEGATDDPSALTAIAFSEGLGTIGGYIVTISLFFFVVSTVIVLSFYGEKQAEFLFGTKAVWVLKVVYVASIFVGAIGGAKVIWSFLDISLAGMAIPNTTSEKRCLDYDGICKSIYSEVVDFWCIDIFHIWHLHKCIHYEVIANIIGCFGCDIYRRCFYITTNESSISDSWRFCRYFIAVLVDWRFSGR